MEPNQQKNSFLHGEGDRWFTRNPFNPDEIDHIDKLILKHIPLAGNLLEIGCSDGRRLQRARHQLRLMDLVVGVDPSSLAIQRGNEQFGLDLRVGTADSIPVTETFSTVIIGFCLYLCDREDLPNIVSEVDRVLDQNGTIILLDFDVKYPYSRPYHHLPGLNSYKMDYSQLFLSLPQYVLSHKYSFSHVSIEFELEQDQRIAIWVLRKVSH